MKVSVRSLEHFSLTPVLQTCLQLLTLWTSDAVLEVEVRLRSVYISLCPCDCVCVRWGEYVLCMCVYR